MSLRDDARAIAKGPRRLHGRSRRSASIGVTALAVIALASFVLGLNQARFLTCEDFASSGNANPPGCVHDTPAEP